MTESTINQNHKLKEVKTMKKVISMIMMLAILALAAIAYADGNAQESTTDVIQPSEQTQSGPMTGGPNEGYRPAGQPPQMPSGNQNGNQQNGQPPQKPGSEGPVMIDFDAMVTKGVISQETCDKIKAYMEEHKPADMPNNQPSTNAPEMTAENPTEDQTPPEKPDGGNSMDDAPEMGGGLLADLLKDGIITQAEYDALIAAQTAETT
jgi:hypothetical protein